MRGGAGDGTAAKENSAMPGWARLPGKICVCEDMVAIFRCVKEIQNFWSSDGAVRRRFPTLATLEDTGARAQVPAPFASNTTHRVHRSIEFLALRNRRRAGTYDNPDSAVGVAVPPRPYRASPGGVPGRRGRGSSTADPKNDRTSFCGVSPPGALVSTEPTEMNQSVHTCAEGSV